VALTGRVVDAGRTPVKIYPAPVGEPQNALPLPLLPRDCILKWSRSHGTPVGILQDFTARAPVQHSILVYKVYSLWLLLLGSRCKRSSAVPLPQEPGGDHERMRILVGVITSSFLQYFGTVRWMTGTAFGLW